MFTDINIGKHDNEFQAVITQTDCNSGNCRTLKYRNQKSTNNIDEPDKEFQAVKCADK